MQTLHLEATRQMRVDLGHAKSKPMVFNRRPISFAHINLTPQGC